MSANAPWSCLTTSITSWRNVMPCVLNLSNKYLVSLGMTSVSVSDSNANPLRWSISFKG